MATATFVATIDSYLEKVHGPDTNYGWLEYAVVGPVYMGGSKAGLFHAIGNFDVSSLAGEDITAAKLVHNIIVRDGSGAANWVKRCTRPSTWTELGVTWNKYNGTNNWTAAGGDWDNTTPTPVGFNIPASTGAFEITGMLAFVIDAIANRSNIVSVFYLPDNADPGSTQSMRWDTREGATEALRWKLVVEYSPVDLGRRSFDELRTGSGRRERRPCAPAQPSVGRRPLVPSGGVRA